MVYIILGNGFEEIEAVAPCDVLRRGGVDVRLCGIGGKVVASARDVRVEADMAVDDIDENDLEMIVLPGGMGGVAAISGCERVLGIARRAWEQGKFVAAICAGPTVLASIGITDGKNATCYPGMENEMGGAKMQDLPAVRDGMLITGRAAGSAIDFGLALLAALRGNAAAEKVRKGMVYGA